MANTNFTKEVHAHLDSDGFNIGIVNDDDVTQIQADASWGLVSYKNEAGKMCGYSFYKAHGSAVHMSDGIDSIDLNFRSRKRWQGFSVKVNGEDISPDTIIRFCFYANADIGPIIVSFAPSWQADARPIVMALGGKQVAAPILRHLAVVWLYEIFDKSR